MTCLAACVQTVDHIAFLMRKTLAQPVICCDAGSPEAGNFQFTQAFRALVGRQLRYTTLIFLSSAGFPMP